MVWMEYITYLTVTILYHHDSLVNHLTANGLNTLFMLSAAATDSHQYPLVGLHTS